MIVRRQTLRNSDKNTTRERLPTNVKSVAADAIGTALIRSGILRERPTLDVMDHSRV